MLTILLVVLLALVIVQLIRPLPAPAGLITQTLIIVLLLCWLLGIIPGPSRLFCR